MPTTTSSSVTAVYANSGGYTYAAKRWWPRRFIKQTRKELPMDNKPLLERSSLEGRRFTTRSGRIVDKVAKDSTGGYAVRAFGISYMVDEHGRYAGTQDSAYDIFDRVDTGEFVVGQRVITRSGLPVLIERVVPYELSEWTDEDKAWWTDWKIQDPSNEVNISKTYCLYGTILQSNGKVYTSWTQGGRYLVDGEHQYDLFDEQVFELTARRKQLAEAEVKKLGTTFDNLPWAKRSDGVLPAPPREHRAMLLSIKDFYGTGQVVIPAYYKLHEGTQVKYARNPQVGTTTEIPVKFGFFASEFDSTPINPDIINAWTPMPYIRPAQ